MKTPKIIWNILFMFAIFTLSLSCTDDDKESNNKFEITSESIDLFQNKISIDVPQAGKQHSLSVTTSESATWKIKITKGGDFITATPLGDQKGSGEITITIQPNEKEAEREGTISISNSLGSGKTISFTQEGKIDNPFHCAVMGDLHYGLKKDEQQADVRVPRALKMILQKQPKIKALFICGDFTNYGTVDEYQKITELINQNVPSTIKVYYMLGNHDTAGGTASAEAYTQYTGQSFYQYIEKGGYPFITISVNPNSAWSADYNDEGLEFLANKLKAAAITYKDKPIFVFSHSPSKRTPWGAKWGYDKMDKILKEYPQVIHFTGHTHYTIEDERSIWQNEYTWINVGPSHYANISTDITPDYEYPDSGKKITEAVIVDIEENTDIKVNRLDTYNEKELKTPWLIKAPHNGSQFKYFGDMQTRTDKDASPVMNGTPQVTDITEYGCNITFNQGEDDSFIWHYKVEAIDTRTQEIKYTRLVLSDFYWRNGTPETLSCPVSGLTPDTEYKISIKGVDSFFSESQPVESTTFTTNALPPVDPSVKAPKADLVDIVFTNTEAQNVAASGLAVTKKGTGTPIGYNTDLKMYVIKPNTTGSISNYYMVDYKGNTTYTNGVKNGFTYEVYCKTSDIKTMQYPLSNLQSAGMGFTFNETYTDPKGATFSAMIRGDGKYHKLNFMKATDVKANTYYHLLFTWNGEQICLYLDGEFVASDVCKKLTMPSGDAQYICIGADSNSSPSSAAQNAFKGEVAIARVYSKAVNASEVASLYKQLTTRSTIAEFTTLNSLLTSGSLSQELATEGWALMNNIATSKEELDAFITKVNSK